MDMFSALRRCESRRFSCRWPYAPVIFVFGALYLACAAASPANADVKSQIRIAPPASSYNSNSALSRRVGTLQRFAGYVIIGKRKTYQVPLTAILTRAAARLMVRTETVTFVFNENEVSVYSVDAAGVVRSRINIVSLPGTSRITTDTIPPCQVGCGGGGGGGGICPDCTWDPIVSNSVPQDLGQNLYDGPASCGFFGFSYDGNYQVCFSLPIKKMFHVAYLTYGQCKPGTYAYTGGEYLLSNCPVPKYSSVYKTTYFATFTTVLTSTVYPPASQPGGTLATVGAIGPRAAFTNLHLCFASLTDACAAGGGGLSVGLGGG